jgi:hypothetical protein
MKRGWIIALAVLGILLISGWFFRGALTFLAMRFALTPSGDFVAAEAPAAPDYAQSGAWAALPETNDLADFAAPGETDRQADARVDVFFVYPTTYYKDDGWNAPLDDADANRIMEFGVLRGQASAYNACCRIHAPRYRQAALAAFFDNSGNGDEALALAYGDVLAAFQAFLGRIGPDAPFVLAGHSQGSAHLQKLISEEVSGRPLLERMIAAYPVGFGWNRKDLEKLGDIPVCASPTQTGCVVTWNAVGPKAQAFGDISDNICVNPLNWADDDSRVPHEGNVGSLALGGMDANTQPELIAGVADARCQGGRLLVSELRSDKFGGGPITFGQDNYHILDYSLFYLNLRRNAVERVNAWLGQQPATEPGPNDVSRVPHADSAP